LCEELLLAQRGFSAGISGCQPEQVRIELIQNIFCVKNYYLLKEGFQLEYLDASQNRYGYG
jgi:tRNA U34 5-carboxymethylaminomethyl modifying enzyme MnmG/GidA